MNEIDFLRASDGTGEAVRAIVQSTRSIASTTLEVDSVDNWPTKFVATTGTLSATPGVVDPATVTIFKGHLSGGDIIIDEFSPATPDDGNSVGQIVVIKPATFWADTLADLLEVSHDQDGTLKADSVDTQAIEDGAVTNAKLATGAGEPGGAWDTFATTVTNLTIGNGSVNFKYKKVGRTIDFELSINGGSTTSVTGALSFTLPEAAASIAATKNFIAYGRLEDSGNNGYLIFSELTTATPSATSAIFVAGAGGSYVGIAAVTGTVPYSSFGNGDSIFLSGSYEAAA
jgi:hypothetical protein